MEHIHLIGIGGTGLSAIATVLLEQGYRVSGSDLSDSPLSESVRRAGGTVYLGHQATNIQGADLVVRSSAVPDTNPEVLAALAEGIPVLKRAEFLGRLLDGKTVLAVAGSHGKTTTTSMLVWILSVLNQDPSFIVGGIVANLGTNARAGQGDVFVIEADEYDRMFLGLNPDLAVVTNVEHDHPDLFPTASSFRQAFCDFVQKLRPGGTLILCGEDPGAASLAGEISGAQRVIRYGLAASGMDYIARSLTVNKAAGYDFEVIIRSDDGQRLESISLQVPGVHNVLNALAAFTAADVLGLERREIARALGEFKGSERRFDIRGVFQEVVLIDDYAHHPTEIRSTLEAARIVYPDRYLRCVWQPHTYSRTITLFDDFVRAFNQADEVVLLDVYPARETKPDGFSILDLAGALEHPRVSYLPGKVQACDYLKEDLKAGDVLLVFSAGDAIEINQELETYLSAQERTERGDYL